MIRNLVAASALALGTPALAGEAFHVDPEVGNSTLSAVFDATLGERINAVSSEIACDLTYDEKAASLTGSCSVPLTSLMVDSNETKSEHFHQWATQKKSAPKSCRLEARFNNVKVQPALAPNQPSTFSADVPFTVCGRSRTDNGKERVTGTVVLFPAGSYGPARMLKARARIERFSRERYQIGPRWTEGWLSRVQSLASVVADEGTIELSLFARSKESAKAQETR